MELLNQVDIHGCTPLHYASREGNLLSLDTFIEDGAKVMTKDNQKYSPLHFAAK